MDRLIREDDMAVYGDKGYANDAKKRAAEEAGVTWAVKEKAKRAAHATQRDGRAIAASGKVRAIVEHVFRVREVPVRLSPRALSRRCERRAGGRCCASPISISSAAGLRLRDGKEWLEYPEWSPRCRKIRHIRSDEPRPDRETLMFRGSLEI